MSEIATLYDLEITTITPLHIGSGQELMLDYDFIVREGNTFRLDVGKILDAWLEGRGGKFDRLLMTTPPGRLLESDDHLARPEFISYSLSGAPRSTGEGAKVREQIKDAWDRPYLPGSSVKGALRTALARAVFDKRNLRVEMSALGRRREWAGQQVERNIFGRNPNYDLMRAVQVTDSQPVEPDSLMLVNAQVIVGRSGGSPVELEAVKPGVTFRATLRLDEYLLGTAARKLGFTDVAHLARQLPAVCRDFALARVKEEMAFFKAAGWGDNLLQLYDVWSGMLSEMKDGDGFLLQVGWGGGWDSKTLGRERLGGDSPLFDRIRETYGLGRPPHGERDWSPRPGERFPRSRRLVVSAAGKPVVPLGWLRVEIEETK